MLRRILLLNTAPARFLRASFGLLFACAGAIGLAGGLAAIIWPERNPPHPVLLRMLEHLADWIASLAIPGGYVLAKSASKPKVKMPATHAESAPEETK
jgi:hypothetical protein